MKMSSGHFPDRDTERDTAAKGSPPRITSPIVTQILVHSCGVATATERQCRFTAANTSGEVALEEARQGEISSVLSYPSPHSSADGRSGSGVCAPSTKMYERSSTGSRAMGAGFFIAARCREVWEYCDEGSRWRVSGLYSKSPSGPLGDVR